MRVAFYTLGCKVNLYESEVMMNKFIEKGYELADFKDKSDIYVINTCTVTNNSDIKARKTINSVKKNHPDSILVVCGCYTQVTDIDKTNIDIIIGNTKKSNIVNLIEEYIKTNKPIYNVENIMDKDFETMSLEKFNTRTRGFVKIQDGCNNYCSYCIIPYARGNIRSKDMNDIIDEVTKLVNNNYIEIVLTGIHTGHYGKEKGTYDLSDLLINLSKIEGLKRIRLSSIETTEIDDKFLNILKNIDIIADHFHIPLQSGCDKTLKEMNRKYDINYFKDKINQIRSIRPNISITTDVIVGFPNETDSDFKETLDNIKDIRFSKLHVFPYSKRNGTKAASMKNQVDGITKKKRVNTLLELSKELEINYMNKFIGETLTVIGEEIEDNYMVGHTSNYLLLRTKDIDLNKLKNIKITNINYPYVEG